MNILIGEISSYKAIVICRFIHYYYPQINVYTFDCRKRFNFIHTKYSYKHFKINQKEYDKEIKNIIYTNNIDYFFPVINETLSQFWKHKHEYGKTLSYLGNYSTYLLLNNKLSLNKLAYTLNIKVPRVYNNIDNVNIPVVVKPKDLSSAKGVYYLKNKSDLENLVISKDIIVQDYINGIGVGYSFYAKNGSILNSFGHKRLAEYPVSGGSSTYREEYNNNEMGNIAQTIVSNLNYTGFAMFEFKLTPDNELYLIEVNPRIWGSINLGMANGVNYFESIFGPSHYQQQLKNHNLKIYLSPLVYLSMLKYLVKFDFKPFLNFFYNIKQNKADINLFVDPLGFFSTLLRRLS